MKGGIESSDRVFYFTGLFIFLLGVPLAVSIIIILILTPKPRIDDIKPPEGFAGETVEIMGINFSPDKDRNVVKFNDVRASIKEVERGKTMMIKATIPRDRKTGSVYVTVTRRIFRRGQKEFTIIGEPRIDDFYPKRGFKGTLVRINGVYFDKRPGEEENNIVKIGGKKAPIFSVGGRAGEVGILAYVPDQVKEGTEASITVKTPAGEATSTQSFYIFKEPTISGVLPKRGFTPQEGFVRTEVTISGTDFDDLNEDNNIVEFNHVPALIKQVSSTKEIVVYVPDGAVTGPITVETPAGTATSSELFHIVGEPGVEYFQPLRAQADETVRIVGRSFDGNIPENNIVKFGEVDATIESVNSEGAEIVVKVPKRAGDGRLTVTTPAGTAKSKANFQALPKIARFEPPGGPPGTRVFVYGYGFIKGSTAKIDDLPGANVSEVKDLESGEQSISFIVPSGAKTGYISIIIDQDRRASYDKDFFSVHRKIGEIPFEHHPPRSAYYTYNKIEKRYRTYCEANNVIVTDFINESEESISVGRCPTDIAIHPDPPEARAYVTNFGDNSISIIDTNTDQVIGTIDNVGSNPIRIAVLHGWIHVLRKGNPQENQPGSVISILDHDHSERQTNPVGIDPQEMKVTNGWIYVVSRGQKNQRGTVTAILGEAPSESVTISVGFDPKRMDVGNNKAYVTNFGNDTVSVIDVDSNKTIEEIYLEQGAAPFGVAINPKRPEAFVTKSGRGAVAVVDTDNDSLIKGKEIKVGKTPLGIAFWPDGTKAFVVNSLDRTVSEIDTNSYKTIGDPMFIGGDEPSDICIEGTLALVTDKDKIYKINISE